jgi:hypothetical protein
MAAKEISVKKYVVRLSVEEREQLEALMRKGKSAAQRLLKARILLKADVSEAGEGWSDGRINTRVSLPCFRNRVASSHRIVAHRPGLPRAKPSGDHTPLGGFVRSRAMAAVNQK